MAEAAAAVETTGDRRGEFYARVRGLFGSPGQALPELCLRVKGLLESFPEEAGSSEAEEILLCVLRALAAAAAPAEAASCEEQPQPAAAQASAAVEAPAAPEAAPEQPEQQPAAPMEQEPPAAPVPAAAQAPAQPPTPSTDEPEESAGSVTSFSGKEDDYEALPPDCGPCELPPPPPPQSAESPCKSAEGAEKAEERTEASPTGDEAMANSDPYSDPYQAEPGASSADACMTGAEAPVNVGESDSDAASQQGDQPAAKEGKSAEEKKATRMRKRRASGAKSSGKPKHVGDVKPKKRMAPDLTNAAPMIDLRTPLMENFRKANEQEQAEFPHVCAAFLAWLRGHDVKWSMNTMNAYVRAIFDLYTIDALAPAEMALPAYRQAVKHTIEEVFSANQHSAGLKHFANFWEERAAETFVGAPEILDKDLKYFQALMGGAPKTVQHLHKSECSEEARKGEDLPEGWHVHTRASSGRLMGWSSPGKRFYGRRHELMVRLGRVSTPQKAVKVAPDPADGSTPAPHSQLQSSQLQTPDPVPLPPRKSLEELLPDPEESEKVTDVDRKLLPGVLATFTRYLSEKTDSAGNTFKRQKSRDGQVISIFKAFIKFGRSLATIAEPTFVDVVAQSEEARGNHGYLVASMRSFSHFWSEVGGYEGKFDQVPKNYLNMSLQVKPSLVEVSGDCGFMCASGEICRRRQQRCETCNTVMCCSKHASHSAMDCREIFWATHNPSGAKTRTMKDFIKQDAGGAEVSRDEKDDEAVMVIA